MQSPISGGVLAVVPGYLAEASVGEVVRAARQHLPVLVVDDGSADRTSEVAREAGATTIRQEPNAGKGVALRTGFRWALDHGAEAVVTLDADLQHDPAELPKFLAAWRAGRPDLVIGARDFGQMPFVRRLSNTVARRAFSWAVGQPIADNQSGYRLLSRRLVEALMQGEREAGYEFEMEQIVVALRCGWSLGWVPIRTIYGDETSHIRPLEHVQKFFRMVMQTRARMRRPV